MELPIQLKFFKKIELYQEYKFQEKKSSATSLQAWKIEKKILKWTTYNHHHLGSLLTKEDIKKRMLGDQNPYGLNHALENLIQREYATGNPEAGIKISKEGLIMGEVINFVDGKFGWVYDLLYLIIWLTTLSGALIVIINAIRVIWDIIKLFFC